MACYSIEECIGLVSVAKLDLAKEMVLGSVCPIAAHQCTCIQRRDRLHSADTVSRCRVMNRNGETVDDTLAYLDWKFTRLHARQGDGRLWESNRKWAAIDNQGPTTTLSPRIR